MINKIYITESKKMETKFKNVLITGASSGIGEAMAQYYAASGAENLFICGRNKERLEAVKQQCEKLGAKVYASLIDVTDREKMQAWIIQSNKKAPLNLVLANAGVASLKEEDENIYNTFNTNIFGVLNTVQPAINLFSKRRGKSVKAIAMLSSIAGYHGLAGCPSYSASKACVKTYGEALRVYWAPKNIQINVICPGFVRSRITEKNTCPMPFFMEAEKAAHIIGRGLENNVGLIAFPWPMRFAVWLLSVLPNPISSFICSKLPYKV